MVDADARLAAQLAYQRALAALHEARADLAGVAAARRRFAYERARLDPAAAAARDADLASRHDRLLELAQSLRDEAAALREVLRRSGDDPGEPPGVRADEGGEGFEQPPYPGYGQ